MFERLKLRLALVLLSFGMILIASGQVWAGNGGCDIRGSWVGGGPAVAASGTLVTYSGSNKNSGEKTLEFVISDPRFSFVDNGANSVCAAATELTIFRGTWERAKSGGGNNVYTGDLLGFGVITVGTNNEIKIPICGIRITNTKTLSADCDSLTNDPIIFEFFGLNEDPLGTGATFPSVVSTVERRIQ